MYLYLHLSTWLPEVSGFPQDLRLISTNTSTKSVVFGWNQISCEQINGVLLGYEVKIYYDSRIQTVRVTDRVTYTISVKNRQKFSFPKAISVAAVNELGVGDHSPALSINQSG